MQLTSRFKLYEPGELIRCVGEAGRSDECSAPRNDIKSMAYQFNAPSLDWSLALCTFLGTVPDGPDLASIASPDTL
jgi:hypothetical protein